MEQRVDARPQKGRTRLRRALLSAGLVALWLGMTLGISAGVSAVNASAGARDPYPAALPVVEPMLVAEPFVQSNVPDLSTNPCGNEKTAPHEC